MVIRLPYVIGVLLVVAGYSSLVDAQSRHLDLRLRDGALVKLEVESSGFEWRDVNNDFVLETIPWERLERLVLAKETAQSQVMKLKALLNDLANESYAAREKAESLLSNASFAGPHKSLIVDKLKRTEDAETRHRLRRILAVLADVGVTSGYPQLDRLVLKGTQNQDAKALTRNGDAADCVVQGKAFGGQEVEFRREQIASITLHREAVVNDQARLSFTPIKTFNQIDREVFDVDSEMISFEIDAQGVEIPVGKTLDDFFVSSGLRMRTELAGFLQLIKYPFRNCPIESGKRCVCPYDAQSDKKLRGVSIFTFCVPGQPNSVAGVRKFGLFLERVEHSRDIVVEAYDWRGQMVGMVEASDQVCVFAGFQSETPVSMVRVCKNDTLPNLDRTMDDTYAFDCLFFDRPRPLPELAPSARSRSGKQPAFTRVNMKMGDELIVDHVRLGEQDVAFVNPYTGKREARLWEDVDSLAHAQLVNNVPVVPLTMIQLTDGSIVRADPKNLLSSYDFIGHEFAKNQVVAAWMGTCRLPYDIEVKDKPVIVFPSCQVIAEQFELFDDGFGWDNESSAKRLQKVRLGNLEDPFDEPEKKDPDPVPDVGQFNFSSHAKTENANRTAPTIWLDSPVLPDPKLGFIQFTDGQYLVLNSELGFEVSSIDQSQRSITIEINGITKTYPLSRIRSLSLRPN